MNTLEEPVVSARIEAAPPSHDRLSQLDLYWRATKFLDHDQVYLQGNPRLCESLSPEHLKPRLLDLESVGILNSRRDRNFSFCWRSPANVIEQKQRHAIARYVTEVLHASFTREA